MSEECIRCILKSSKKLINKFQLTPDDKAMVSKRIFTHLSEINQDTSSPQIVREIMNILSSITDNHDLFIDEKKLSNDLLLNKYEELRAMVLGSSNSFDTALRLSIAGNIIDFAANPKFFDNSKKYLEETIDKVMQSDFAIDDSKLLSDRIDKAETILFLGDNSGEIVMDKLFLETISHANVYYAVRGNPILNDATVDDAEYVKIKNYAKVIENGNSAPSTILHQCSDDFLDIYNKADIIISKGQGNFEGLYNSTNDKIFFLLMVKCDVIAKHLNLKVGDFIVKRNSNLVKDKL